MIPHNPAALREKLAGRRVVASISGGKDSAAMSLYLREMGIEHDRVFMDTGWEADITYEYLRGELTRALGPIAEIRGPHLMADLVRSKGMFPTRIKRFCTQKLKVEPMQRHITALVDAGADLVNAVGIRSGESRARSKMTEWEWSDGFDCEVWRPLIAWTEQDVIDIHTRHGLRPNPLYLRGASRVGCWPCIYARKSELRFIAENDPERIDRIRSLEEEVSEARTRRREAKGQTQLGPAAWFNAQQPDANGIYQSVPIDDAVAWSRTSRGGRQFELFAAAPGDAGCMRWGLCETSAPDDGEEAA